MAKPPKYGSRDKNEQMIVENLTRLGIDVYRLDEPGDLLVEFRGLWIVLEVKVPGEGKLTPKQQKFHKRTRAPVSVVTTITEAINALEYWSKQRATI